MKSKDGLFPTTDWGLLGGLGDQTTASKRVALDVLIRRYWKPVYLFLRRFGHDEERAKDLTQAFFFDWLQKDAFEQADPQRGRFRTFLLTCLKRFSSNVNRAEHAAIRRPPEGWVSIQELMEGDHVPFEPADSQTPEMIFNQAWARELIGRVLDQLEQSCRSKGHMAHYEILRGRIVDPILSGSEKIPTAVYAEKFGLTEKQVFNHLDTAKRAYRQLMKDEISLYAESAADISGEMNDLFRIVGGSW